MNYYYTSYKPSVNKPSMTIGLHIFEHERNSIKNVIQLRIMNYEACDDARPISLLNIRGISEIRVRLLSLRMGNSCSVVFGFEHRLHEFDELLL